MQSVERLPGSLFGQSQNYDLAFKDVFCEVTHGKRKKETLEILHGISGSASKGEVTGILGPSGAGKTTLLNILSCRNHGKIRGEVLLNDKRMVKSKKKCIGYVMQKDYFFSELTIEETLRYTALLRRGGEKNHAEIDTMVKEVITMMGLERCAQTLLGDAFNRGISGGELKRVNIGNEILVDPSILFLDEPTSGLDSTSAVAVLSVLRGIARTHSKTIILSIHQPSSMAFHMLDKVICMMNGHIVYQGPAIDLAAYLTFIGYPLTLGWNVADHVMDLLCNSSMVDSLVARYRQYVRVDPANGKHYMHFFPSPPSPLLMISEVSTALPPATQAIAASSENISTVEENANIPDLTEVRIEPLDTQEENLIKTKSSSSFLSTVDGNNTSTTPPDMALRAPHYLRLTYILLQRSLKKDFKGIVTGLNITQAALIGIVVGFLWFQSFTRSRAIDFQDHLGFFYFGAAFWTFLPAFSALTSFPNERTVIAKERSSKMYPISAYLFSKTFSDVVVLFIAPLVWFSIALPLAGYPFKPIEILGLLLILMVNVFVSHSVGMVVVTMVSGIRAATVVLSVFLLACVLSTGFFVRISNLTVWITWLRWISMQYYSTSMMLHVSTRNILFLCAGEPPDSTCRISGEILSVPFVNGFSILANLAFLLLYWSICKGAAYLFLRFGKQLKLQG